MAWDYSLYEWQGVKTYHGLSSTGMLEKHPESEITLYASLKNALDFCDYNSRIFKLSVGVWESDLMSISDQRSETTMKRLWFAKCSEWLLSQDTNVDDADNQWKISSHQQLIL